MYLITLLCVILLLQWTFAPVLCVHLFKSTRQINYNVILFFLKSKKPILIVCPPRLCLDFSPIFPRPFSHLQSLLFPFCPFPFVTSGITFIHNDPFVVYPSLRNTFWRWWVARSSCCSQWRRWRGCSCLMMSMCLRRRPWWPRCSRGSPTMPPPVKATSRYCWLTSDCRCCNHRWAQWYK